jgi:hypothetical protein
MKTYHSRSQAANNEIRRLAQRLMLRDLTVAFETIFKS